MRPAPSLSLILCLAGGLAATPAASSERLGPATELRLASIASGHDPQLTLLRPAAAHSCSDPRRRPSPAACVQLQDDDSAAEPTAGRSLGVVYTQRFLPGFSVTVDRAPSVLSGFVAGLGRSLAAGRNCFSGACPLGPGTMLDTSAAATGDGLRAAPEQDVFATSVGVAALSAGYAFDLAAGGQPVVLEARAGQLLDAAATAPADLATDDLGASLRGERVALALRRGPLEFSMTRDRLRFLAAAGVGSESLVATRQELRVSWRQDRLQLDLLLADTAYRDASGPQATATVGLQFRLGLP